jgi:hypothetical protein
LFSSTEREEPEVEIRRQEQVREGLIMLKKP